MVLEKKIFKVFFHYKSTETLDPRGGVSLDPKGLICRIYVRTIRYFCGIRVFCDSVYVIKQNNCIDLQLYYRIYNCR